MARRLRRSLSVILFVTAVSVAASGSLAVMQARTRYYGVCSTLGGFLGLLQRAGFIAQGSCSVPVPGGVLCNAGSTCTVNSLTGVCQNQAQPGGAALCICNTSITPQSGQLR
jgi:hypothetical protein